MDDMKFKNLISVFLTSAIIISCSSNNDEPMEPDSLMKITYEAHIRDIITGNCIACHDNPPSSGAPMSLNGYEFVKNAVQTRGLLDRINSTTNPMPPKNGPLTKEERDLIQKWVDDGLLEK